VILAIDAAGHGVDTTWAPIDPYGPFETAFEQFPDVMAQEVVSGVQAGTWSVASGPSKRLHQSLKPPGRAVEPLACIDYLDFDDWPLRRPTAGNEPIAAHPNLCCYAETGLSES
jgi:hypothetical protein